MFKVSVVVTYKPSVLDPQAEVIEGAIQRLGYQGVSNLKLGKQFDFVLEAESREVASQMVDEICDTLLANVNMETYSFELTEDN